MSFRPPEFCRSCLNNDTATCELPSKLEIAGKVAKSAVVATLEGMSHCADFCIVAPPTADVSGPKEPTDTFSGIRNRVAACVKYHEEDDPRTNPGW